MSYDDIIRDHYRNEAETCGLGKDSTMRDEFVRDAETRFIRVELEHAAERLKSVPVILDVGCGNASLLTTLSEAYPGWALHGLEFSTDLYELAKSRQLKNVEIRQGDCREPVYDENTFDVVITERMLINLLDRGDQLKALGQIHRALRPGGRYLMIESFAEPLENLNRARRELMINDIPEAHHNLYLDRSVIEAFSSIGYKKLQTEIPETYLSTHFFVSRVVHEIVRPKDGKFRNTEFVKFFDSVLPSAIGDYSPIQFLLFEKCD